MLSEPTTLELVSHLTDGLRFRTEQTLIPSRTAMLWWQDQASVEQGRRQGAWARAVCVIQPTPPVNPPSQDRRL